MNSPVLAAFVGQLMYWQREHWILDSKKAEWRELIGTLALVLLLTVTSEGKTKSEADFEWAFTVTSVSAGSASAHRYCPMTLTAGEVAYSVYSQSWQCVTFPIQSQVKGTFTKGVWLSVGVHADAIELMYHTEKGKLKTVTYVVDTQSAAQH
jgi:hypothetical protein